MTTVDKPAGGVLRAGRVLALALCPVLPAAAGNGINMIGFGAESLLLGGADIAVAQGTAALNTNPAGLAQLPGRTVDLHSAMAFALDVGHADRFGNDQSVDNRVIPIAAAGLGAPLADGSVVLGTGLFVQGGAGAVYKHLNTAFGTRDELSSQFGVVRLTPGIAIKASDHLSLGASLPINRATVQQKVFPRTSALNPADPAHPFFGFEIKGASATRMGMRLGAIYRVADTLTLAATYEHRSPLPVSGGRLVANLGALGLGHVRYSEVRIDGLALPREVSLGAAWQTSPATRVSFKTSWLEWSHALERSRLRATSPDNPLAPPVLRGDSALGWRNQWVFALGVEHALDARTAVLGGYNYGHNPIPPEHLNPLLAAIGERHLTLGMRRRFDDAWEAIGGLEYLFANKLRYTNAELPFGANAQERERYVALHFTLNHYW
jgi:long-chain fatty acid transport protein